MRFILSFLLMTWNSRSTHSSERFHCGVHLLNSRQLDDVLEVQTAGVLDFCPHRYQPGSL